MFTDVYGSIDYSLLKFVANLNIGVIWCNLLVLLINFNLGYIKFNVNSSIVIGTLIFYCIDGIEFDIYLLIVIVNLDKI